MEQIEMLINQLPAPTWNRLKMNEAKLVLQAPQDVCEPLVALQGSVCLNKIVNKEMGLGCCACDKTETCPAHSNAFGKMPTGLGEQFAQVEATRSLRLVADAGKSTATLTMRYLDGQNAYNKLEIEAKENADLTVIMTYISTAPAAGTASVQTKVLAGKNAKVKLVQVQLLGHGFVHVNDVGSSLADGASFKVIQLQLGAGEVYNGTRSELVGVASTFEAALGYYGRQAQKLDFNYIANHYGAKTECNMTADGVLQEGAQKIYRGTIDFKNGCAGALGNENENVLLLSDDIVNQSIPLILCDEEDVQGNHGASIGKLDEDLLFYLCSRGFSESDAVNMMAKGKIEALCRQIEDEDTVQVVERYLEGVIVDGE